MLKTMKRVISSKGSYGVDVMGYDGVMRVWLKIFQLLTNESLVEIMVKQSYGQKLTSVVI